MNDVNDELIKEFPGSGQKIVSLVNNSKFGKCIKKVQKMLIIFLELKRK